MKFKLAAPIAVVMLAAACGGGTTREDAIEELTAVGFEQSTAECLLDDFEAKGYEPSDLEDDSFTPEVEAVFDESLQKCITGADITGVADDGELRQAVIDGMTGTGDVTEEQANCAVDQLEADGISLAELAGAEFEGDSSAADALGAALISCL